MTLIRKFTLIVLVSYASISGAASRGINIVDADGSEVGGYGASYALLIGVSDYVSGWPDLNSISGELQSVGALLDRKGFNVKTVMNPDADELEEAFEDFIDDYGYEASNRLLFYFAGHGFTRDEGNKGYLVPVDAPLPNENMRGFLRRAFAMTDLLALARKMESNHALFLFDSCFSGTIFKTRAVTTEVPLIDRLTGKPVRQFITAGDADEEVPAKSVFTPAFIDSLEYGLGDLNSDGFVTGTELGLYLQSKVAKHAAQTPQFGKISDYELSRGDFVFAVSQGQVADEIRTESVWTQRGLSGHWKGRYYYEDGRDSVPFYADIFEIERGFEGRISEPNTFLRNSTTLSLTAEMRGTTSGNEVQFIKTYNSAGAHDSAIEYRGALAKDGQSIAGRWYLQGNSGKFELYRR